MATTRLVEYASVVSADDDASGNTLVMRDANGAIEVTGVTTDALAVGEGATLNHTIVTTTYTALATDLILLCDSSGAAFTITLPAAASVPRKLLWIKKTETSANAITVDGSGAETIEGAATYSVAASARNGVLLYCDGSAWHALLKF